MIDLGKLPRILQKAIGYFCDVAEYDLENDFEPNIMIDSADSRTLTQWLNTLSIFNPGNLSEVQMRNLIYLRLRTGGNVNISYFATLATLLGWTVSTEHEEDLFEPDNINTAKIPDFWQTPTLTPKLYISDKHFFDFRGEINYAEDMVYDEQWGSNTIVVVFDGISRGQDNELFTVFNLARVLGTRILFYRIVGEYAEFIG